MPPLACSICGTRCVGKAGTCSPACKAERRRRDQRRFRERQRGGPRRCVSCGEIITATTATNVCSRECRRARRLGVPRDQLPPPGEPLAASAVCDVCGILFRPIRPRQKGCSSACQRIGRLRRKLACCRKGPYPPRPCCVCGRDFFPDRKVGRVCSAPACRSQHKRDLAAARAAGQLCPGNYVICCIVCGEEVRAQWNTLTCAKPECFRERRRQMDRYTRGFLPCACLVCGARFWPPLGKPGAHYTCSPECSRVALLRRRRRIYEAHREERLAQQAERLRTDPAYRARRQEIDRQYRQRLAEAQLAQTAEELQRRMRNDQEE